MRRGRERERERTGFCHDSAADSVSASGIRLALSYLWGDKSFNDTQNADRTAVVSTHHIKGQVNTVSDISSAHYPSLFEALRLLPGIAPRQERDRLGRAKYQATRSPGHTVDFSGVQLTLTQLQELFIYDQQRRPRVSRAGAALLLFLFEEGAFPSIDGRKVDGNPEVLGQYSKGLASVVALNSRRGSHRIG
ncbi:MAG TPA: hypothetical protein VEJ00_10355 [Candidatus Acidoferrales bacterium]|nr:hypothetical protein [Candidatus Acidoferrales bacterium]